VTLKAMGGSVCRVALGEGQGRAVMGHAVQGSLPRPLPRGHAHLVRALGGKHKVHVLIHTVKEGIGEAKRQRPDKPRNRKHCIDGDRREEREKER
jgi:hypothetical protein